jgi:hypothetical protein
MFSVLYKTALALHKRPWRKNGPCNVVLGAGQQGRWPDSGELTAVLGRGSSWGGARVRQGSICPEVEDREGRWQARPAEQGGGRRCSWNSGEGTARPGQQAGRGGRVGPRGGPGGAGRCRKRAGRAAHRGDSNGARDLHA